MKNKNSHMVLVIVVIFDLIILLSAYIFSKYASYYFIKVVRNFDITEPIWQIREVIVSLALIGILFIALEKFEFTHAYRFKPFFGIIKKLVQFELFLVSIFYAVKVFRIYSFQNTFVGFYSIITFTIFLTERAFIKIFLMILRKRGYDYKNYLIIGAGEVGLDFYRMAISFDELGIRIVGFLDDNENLSRSNNPIYTDKIKSLLLGKIDKLETILNTNMIDNVIVALPMNYVDKMVNIFNICENNGVKAELIPRYSKILSDNTSVRKIKNFTLFGLHNVPLENMFNRFIKRLFDITLSLFGLILCLPLFIIVAIIIKIQSKGPVFFKQERTGYNQKAFNILKFRTMRLSDDANTKQATKDDPRKTKIGNFLRKTNIDELPQLINILKGDMSMVGPRPHMLAHTKEFHGKYDKYHVRHWVKPGLTGWAQVNGWRGDSDIGMRIKYDIDYIENWSLYLDIKIFFLTIFGKKVKRHAY